MTEEHDLDLRPRLRDNPYTILLATLVLLLVVWPAISQAKMGDTAKAVVHGVFFTLMLGGILHTVSAGRKKHWFLWFVVLALVADWMDNLIEGKETSIIGAGVGAAFLAIVTIFVVRRVFAPGKVTADRIVAALCAYLFLGMFWANLYSMIHILNPYAFEWPDGEVVRHTDFTYFSFVTLTTLGYGEINPIDPLARSLAFMEAVFGQLYIAIVIARLVALELVNRHEAG